MKSPTSSPRRCVGLLVAAALVAISACVVRAGSNPASSPVAERPHGTTIAVDWRGPERLFFGGRAELLAVADTGVFLLHDGRAVVFYPRGVDARLHPREAPGVSTLNLRDAVPVELSELGRYARHPFGLDEATLGRLMDSLGQDSLFVRRVP